MKDFPVIDYIHEKHIVRSVEKYSSVYSVKIIRMDDLADWPWFIAEFFIFDIFNLITPSKYRVEVLTDTGLHRSYIKNKKSAERYAAEFGRSEPEFSEVLKIISIMET